MRIRVYILALVPLALAGCVAEPVVPVTTTTTETTREVTTTGPVTTRGVVGGPVTREVVVTRTPPAVRVEAQTVAPGRGYVWTRGYWRWSGTDYVWVPGSWMSRPSAAAVWVDGTWVRRPGGGYVWVSGHWR